MIQPMFSELPGRSAGPQATARAAARPTRSRGTHASAVALFALLALAGCAVKPVAIETAEHRTRAQADAQRLGAGQDEVPRELSLSQAVARAIRYNQDYRIRLMEQATAAGQLELAQYDLLPKLTVSAGYSTRNNESFGYGFTPDGSVSSNPSASVERSRLTGSASFAWNVLDFGLSYVRARQYADQSLIAEERRRKALQTLVQDVRTAFWRAEAAQRLLPEAEALLVEIDRMSARARFIADRKLLPPLQIQTYRRSLLDLEQQIALRLQDLEAARIEFAALLNLPPGTSVRLVAPYEPGDAPMQFAGREAALIALALESRPELREEGYRIRLTDLEAMRQRYGALIPGIGLDAGPAYDSNKYLLNNTWVQLGLSASANLLKLLTLPAIERSRQTAQQLDDARRLATTGAVLAQVRLAVSRHELLEREYRYWEAGEREDERIVASLKAGNTVGLETELELARAQARLLVTRLNTALVYANLQSATGRVFNSVGLDAVSADAPVNDLDALAVQLDRRLGAWEQQNFVVRAAPTLPSVSVAFSGSTPAIARGPMQAAVTRLLDAAGTRAGAQGDLSVTVDLAIERTAGRSFARLSGTIVDRQNRQVGKVSQRTALLEPVTTEQWSALGEAAGHRIVEAVRAAAVPTPTR